jgi:predicted RNA-binding Zn-ribbon protein involved in translation (DUF1610 family)
MKPIGTLSWARRHVTLDGEPFVPSEFPHLVEPARVMDEVWGARVVLMLPPQSGKTLLAQLKICRDAHVSPRRTLWYSPTPEDADLLADSKLSTLIQGTRETMSHLPTEVDQRGGKKIVRFVDAPLTILGASLDRARQSHSGSLIVRDESWLYKPGALSEIEHRADSYGWQATIIDLMTGPTEGTEAAQRWEMSTQHTWHSVCPSCGAAVVVERGRVEDDHGMRWDLTEETCVAGVWRAEVAAATCRWVCPECRQAVSYSPAVVRAMNDPQRGAGYRALNPSPQPGVYGFRCNGWMFAPWPVLVAEWLRAVNLKRTTLEAVEDFVRKRDCLPWAVETRSTEDVEYPVGDYAMADAWEHETRLPAGEPMRFMTVDLQQNHMWVLVRSWSMQPGHVGESRLRWFGKVHTGEQVEALRAELNVRPSCVWIDCAYNAPRAVQIAQRHGYRVFNATKVANYPHEDGVRRIYAPAERYEAIQAGVRHWAMIYRFSSRSAKDRLQAVRDFRDNEGRPIWTIPRDTPQGATREDDYKAQAWAEQKMKVPSKGGYTWEWRQVYEENHAFDLEVAQVVMAGVVGCVEAVVDKQEEAH